MTLHLHIGAHKTATTHLQATLIRHRAQLAEAGVQFERPDTIRALIGPGRRASAAMGPFPSLRRAAAVRRLAQLDNGSKRILISDENSLGLCAEIFSRELLYPTARRRLQVWRRLCDHRRVIVYLSLRNYAHFFSAAYVQMIRKAPYFELDEITLASLIKMPRRWTDVVQDVRRALPNARVKCWAFEDYDALSSQLILDLTGQTLAPVQRRPMATPSAGAIQAYHRTPKRRRLTLQQFAEEHPIDADTPKFSLWTEDQTEALTELYERDLSVLRAELGEDFLTSSGAKHPSG